MTLTVGIPRALLFYEYSNLWITFFEELGARVIISQKTNRKILNQGIQNSVDEACIPIKLFHGHVVDLKDKVDYIFIPRIISLFEKEYICPKFCGLPEMIKYSIKDLPKIIDTEINFMKSKKDLNDTVYEIGKYFSKDYNHIISAYNKAYLKFKQYKENIKNGIIPFNELDILDEYNYKDDKSYKKIMVLGHPYNLYDSYINMNTINKMRLSGIHILTPEMINESYINIYSKKYEGKLFWTFARNLIGTSLYLIQEKNIDGIIYISSFGCGIDSVLANIVERRIRKESDIPFMLLTLDEHSGECGINTRIEAFIDMLKWRDSNENNISTHG